MELELRGITKRFGPLVANDGISLSVAPGQVHALLGENGAGKTTLMNVLFGLTRPDQGEIHIDGKAASFRSPKDAIAAGIGMVHQHFMLVPVFTVADNVTLGIEQAGRAGLLDAERDILRDREDRHKHEVLVHHADAGRDRVLRRVEARRLAIYINRALVGLDQPEQDVHQRALPRSVLTEQGVHLARGHREADPVVRHERAEPLGDAPELKFHVCSL